MESCSEKVMDTGAFHTGAGKGEPSLRAYRPFVVIACLHSCYCFYGNSSREAWTSQKRLVDFFGNGRLLSQVFQGLTS
jgi:hypothetical protein